MRKQEIGFLKKNVCSQCKVKKQFFLSVVSLWNPFEKLNSNSICMYAVSKWREMKTFTEFWGLEKSLEGVDYRTTFVAGIRNKVTVELISFQLH